MQTRLKIFRQSESGATAIQYGLIVAAVSAALFTAFSAFQRDLTAPFANISAEIGKATTSEPPRRGPPVRPTRPDNRVFRPSEGR